jgi:hypothetical protein
MELGWIVADAGGCGSCREGESDLGSFVVEREAIGLEKKADFDGFDLGDGSRAGAVNGEPVSGCSWNESAKP